MPLSYAIKITTFTQSKKAIPKTPINALTLVISKRFAGEELFELTAAEEVALPLPVDAIVAVGVKRTPSEFVKLVSLAVALPVIVPTVHIFVPVLVR